jgi:hypothetical protein
MRRAKHVARMGDDIKVYKVWWKGLKERDHSEDRGEDESGITMDLREISWGGCGFGWLRLGTGSCEYGDELRVLAPRSWLVSGRSDVIPNNGHSECNCKQPEKVDWIARWRVSMELPSKTPLNIGPRFCGMVLYNIENVFSSEVASRPRGHHSSYITTPACYNMFFLKFSQWCKFNISTASSFVK